MIVFKKSSVLICKVSKIVLISLSFVCYCCSPPNQFSDCSNFKVGKFSFQSDYDGSTTIIERNDSIQTETNLERGSITKVRIIWTGPCEYELYLLSQESSSQDTIPAFLRTRALKTRLLKREKDYCLFESGVDGIEVKLVDTLRILKN